MHNSFVIISPNLVYAEAVWVKYEWNSPIEKKGIPFKDMKMLQYQIKN